MDVLLVDRPVPDALGYYHAALAYRNEAPDSEALAHLRALAVHHSGHYDLIYRTALDRKIPLGTNKPRNADLRFRALADEHVGRVLTELAIPHQRLAADGHDAAVGSAVRFAINHLSGLCELASADLDAT